MCCYTSERLAADNATHVTLVDSMAHGLFDDVQETLSELNTVNRKPFIAQITVWDAKKKAGSPRAARVNFSVGAVYEFRQVHNIGYCSDIAKGNVQLEGPASDRIIEVHPPALKRKGEQAPSPRGPKARALLQDDEDQDREEHRGGASESTVTGRTVATAPVAAVSPAVGKAHRARNAAAVRG
ncbi:hypothetical protein PHMEG_00026282 [Phytophthora megakarya]|uniref:Uncharacterized protein n=1 Tax=Phytophthora megakarya TaxID=4795 RepID=A0A225VBP1_9STRA|nr:hypothetical protein PHMEG_00026282 [Phytophthora megakarya]